MFVISLGQFVRFLKFFYKGRDSSFLSAFVDVIVCVFMCAMTLTAALFVTLGFKTWCEVSRWFIWYNIQLSYSWYSFSYVVITYNFISINRKWQEGSKIVKMLSEIQLIKQMELIPRISSIKYLQRSLGYGCPLQVLIMILIQKNLEVYFVSLILSKHDLFSILVWFTLLVFSVVKLCRYHHEENLRVSMAKERKRLINEDMVSEIPPVMHHPVPSVTASVQHRRFGKT